jgi:hypothetical protein
MSRLPLRGGAGTTTYGAQERIAAGAALRRAGDDPRWGRLSGT